MIHLMCGREASSVMALAHDRSEPARAHTTQGILTLELCRRTTPVCIVATRMGRATLLALCACVGRAAPSRDALTTSGRQAHAQGGSQAGRDRGAGVRGEHIRRGKDSRIRLWRQAFSA